MSDNLQGQQFASLTNRGQRYYGERREDGATHEQAYEDARYSYGTQHGPRANLRKSRRRT